MKILPRALVRFLCNFNAVLLPLLAFQNAGYVVLMNYAQRLQDVPPALGEPPKKRLASSHFLAATEFAKLIFSTMWCTYEVLQDVKRQEQEALLASAEVEHADAGSEEADVFGGDRHNCKAALDSPVLNVNGALPGTPPKPIVYDGFPLRRLFERPKFYAQLGTCMRHALGLDGNYKEALLMVVPAVLYAIQGLLLILALQHLDPTVFQILYQARTMFLAMMMRVVLDLRLSPVRWVALIGLMAGIILAQLTMQGGGGKANAKHGSAPWSVEGTLAALASAFLSSFSGVFMECVFKKRGNLFRLSARNVHLAFFSLVYFCFVFARDIWLGGGSSTGDTPSSAGGVKVFLSTFFDGFTGLVWVLVALQAVGGILVALVMRYCDNIVKSFSTASAIVLSGAASVFLFDLPLDPMFLLGSALVMGSITVYGLKK